MNIKRPKSYINILVLLLLLALLVTACQPEAAEGVAPQDAPADSEPAPAPAEGAPDVPETTQSETVSSSIVLDPAIATDEDSSYISSYLFETLVNTDGNPVLASAWTVSEDGLDYIFELRAGVSFHDGAPFNADAIIANFNRWFSGDENYAAWEDAFGGFSGQIDTDGKPLSIFDGIEKVDGLTVLIHLNQPDHNLLAKLSNPAFAMRSPASTDNASAIGTGSYSITSWTADNFTISPFEGYWGTPATGDNILFEFE